ncbi:MAG: diguanylate cyclase [Alphaproteobacteria bacterium]|nr:diguanylate cyclase [Alphaproteobacteria bacterium]
MDILVIDRESLTNQLISSKLAAKGHTVTVEPNKNEAFEKIKSNSYDCIMVDPYPLSEARPVVVGIWKCLRAPVKPYLLLLSKTATTEEAILAGTNDVLQKPFSSQDIDVKTGNAERLMDISRHLARVDDVHSSGGMIGKAAFNQLFLSAIDRSFRYGERSLIVFIEMTNYDEVAAAGGADGIEDTLRKLTEKMTFMRRQSDVIGRLGAQNFGILLQRPQYETEPLDAINRFSEILDKFYAEFENEALAPKLELNLVELPQGTLHEERFVPARRMKETTGAGGGDG